jgi:hypothetical protein
VTATDAYKSWEQKEPGPRTKAAKEIGLSALNAVFTVRPLTRAPPRPPSPRCLRNPVCSAGTAHLRVHRLNFYFTEPGSFWTPPKAVESHHPHEANESGRGLSERGARRSVTGLGTRPTSSWTRASRTRSCLRTKRAGARRPERPRSARACRCGPAPAWARAPARALTGAVLMAGPERIPHGAAGWLIPAGRDGRGAPRGRGRGLGERVGGGSWGCRGQGTGGGTPGCRLRQCCDDALSSLSPFTYHF